jgi:hypothetical protein
MQCSFLKHTIIDIGSLILPEPAHCNAYTLLLVEIDKLSQLRKGAGILIGGYEDASGCLSSDMTYY